MLNMQHEPCPHQQSSYISYTIEVMSREKSGFSIKIRKHHHPSVYITAVELIYEGKHLVLVIVFFSSVVSA
jgi:hypothetical protein